MSGSSVTRSVASPRPVNATTTAATIADATDAVFRSVEILGRETTTAIHAMPDDADAAALASELDAAGRQLLLVSRAFAERLELVARREAMEAGG